MLTLLLVAFAGMLGGYLAALAVGVRPLARPAREELERHRALAALGDSIRSPPVQRPGKECPCCGADPERQSRKVAACQPHSPRDGCAHPNDHTHVTCTCGAVWISDLKA